MKIFTVAANLQQYLTELATTKTIGFVPTMGALHSGHISLIDISKSTNNITVCSIFVNPAQFNNSADFEKYPITTEADIEVLKEAGCDVLFLPSVAEMYPSDTKDDKIYELGFLEHVFEGKYRPGHFKGVCKAVHRLLDIVICHNVYIGQKDYQQCMVIKKLAEIIDIKVNIIVCPTLRAANGLALSSRNQRLSTIGKEKAALIYQCMEFIQQHLKSGNLTMLKQSAQIALTNDGFKIDYFEIVHANTLSVVDVWDGDSKLVCIVAAYLEDVRLIDNLPLN
jgi:pantoate--beta-alanine ligase